MSPRPPMRHGGNVTRAGHTPGYGQVKTRRNVGASNNKPDTSWAEGRMEMTFFPGLYQPPAGYPV